LQPARPPTSSGNILCRQQRSLTLCCK
jgi:hypothetical protein